jgi:hypothetical protein
MERDSIIKTVCDGLMLKKIYSAALLIIAFLLFPSYLIPVDVDIFHYPRLADNLEARWNWAVKNGTTQGLKNGFWIGYTIKKQMGENTYYVSKGIGICTVRSSYPFHSYMRGKTLGEILHGKRSEPELSNMEQIKQVAKQALDKLKNSRRTQRKVWKDVAILFQFVPNSSKTPKQIKLSDLFVSFDPEDMPIFWLDKADHNQSFLLLRRMYENVKVESQKKRFLSAIGIHSNSDRVVPFLEKVLKSKETDAVRGRAAIELGEHDTKHALEILFQTAKHDHSLYVRKKAVSGLEDMRQEAAVDALIELARRAESMVIRRRAISALGDIASRKTTAALEEFVYNDDYTEVQKQAVYAFEDLPNGEGIPYLIKIAKTHPKVKIRKSAIYCLGDSGDSRARDALIEIIRKK